MSKVYALQDYGFIGWNGDTVRLAAGDEYDHDDPFARAHPEMFTAAEVERPAEPKKRGRRA